MQHTCPMCGSLCGSLLTPLADHQVFLTLHGTVLTLEGAPSNSTIQVAIGLPRGERLFQWVRKLAKLLKKQRRELKRAISSSGLGSPSPRSRKASGKQRAVRASKA